MCLPVWVKSGNSCDWVRKCVHAKYFAVTACVVEGRHLYFFRCSLRGYFGAHFSPDAHNVCIFLLFFLNMGGAHYIIGAYCSPTFTVHVLSRAAKPFVRVGPALYGQEYRNFRPIRRGHFPFWGLSKGLCVLSVVASNPMCLLFPWVQRKTTSITATSLPTPESCFSCMVVLLVAS